MVDQVAEVKDRIDIVELMSTYLTLKKAGANYKANCPFHNEKTPSLMVSPERQTFKCFGCGEGGDVFTFVEKMEGLDFFNTLKLLAERAGVQLKTDSVKYGEREHRADKKTKVFEINEWAKKVYHRILVEHPKAVNAREYLKTRGMKPETIETFEIGYAPDSWDFLLRFLRAKKYSDSEIVESGVVIKSEGGKIFDRFRGRIIFPINNPIGNTIGFTSRILKDDGKSAKYINSAETLIYTKGKTIYGLDKAKVAIKEADLAIMVEGNMDVIACHQAGFKNVVATSGTALTLDQLKVLTRYAAITAFCFDSDEAGQTAMKRAIRMAMQNDVSIKIINMPLPFKDPDEAIKADPDNWMKAVKNAKPALQYWIDRMIERVPDPSIDDKKRIAKEILPVIKIIYSDIEKEHYIKYLSQKLNVSEKSLIDALGKAKTDQEFISSKKEEAPEAPDKLKIYEKILGIIWAEPALIDKIPEEIKNFVDYDNKYDELFAMIKTGEIYREKMKLEKAGIFDQLAVAVLSNRDPKEESSLGAELLGLIGLFRREKNERIMEEYARKIRDAEQSGDREKLKALLSEFSSLIK